MSTIREALSVGEGIQVKHVDRNDSKVAKSLTALGNEFIKSEDHDLDLERLFSKGNLVGLFDGDTLCGFLGYKHIQKVYYVSSICVGHLYRGKGYGKVLLGWLIDKGLANKDIDTINIGVRAENHTALGLYQKLGFKKIDRGVEEGLHYVVLSMKV